MANPLNDLTSVPDFVLYTSPGGEVKFQVFLDGETLWLSQKMMAELFEVEVPTISYHLKEIFSSAELSEDSVIRKILTTAADGKNYETQFYNLDAIISVGYRVNSSRATQFRIWATKLIKEYIIKGYVLDDERLKQGERVFAKDYFKELLERIRSIRASERRVYMQITDIFAECSIDYDKNSSITKEFFATVQNKFHYAITGQTAAEIIFESADATKPHMNLRTWKNSPDGPVLTPDVTVAKNYLTEVEIKKLERTISSFFDYVENLVENHQAFSMGEFAASVDKFLNFNEYKILHSKGRISKERAEQKALAEYAEFNKTQRVDSDFAKEIRKRLSDSER